MGLVVTTNSATLVNKGLEVIEAHLLFDIDYDRIDVVVHPPIDRALDGRVRRRIDHRAGLAARHAPADLARPRLARTRWPPSEAARLDDRAQRVDVRGARRRRVPAVRLAKQVGRAGGGTGRLQRRERAGGGAAFPPGASASPTSSTPCARSSTDTRRAPERSPSTRWPTPNTPGATGGRPAHRPGVARPPASDHPFTARGQRLQGSPLR